MNKFILSLDQGTTSTLALLIDQNGKISGIAQKELTQIYPNNGWVEHNPNEILNSQIEVIDQVISENNIAAKAILLTLQKTNFYYLNHMHLGH